MTDEVFTNSTDAAVLALRVLVAAILGALLGLEREFRGKEAGLRTNTLIAIGSALFTVMSTLMGGDATVRLWHHAATWAFIVFSLVHIYLSVFHDVVERQGEISSMVSGVKFVERR